MVYTYSHYISLGNVRKKIADLVSFTTPATVLDVGTGDGLFAIAFSKKENVKNVLGIELAPEFLALAEKQVQNHGVKNVSFQKTDFFSSELKPGFDCISFFLAVCEFKKPEKVFKRAFELLTPGGFLVLGEEFPELAENKAQKIGYEINRALGYKHFPLKKIKQELEKTGFEILVEKVFKTNYPLMNENDLMNNVHTARSMVNNTGPHNSSSSILLKRIEDISGIPSEELLGP
ncbi:class I SAM-dependent methyltransferase, partial [Candidatus Micrarchaeota archaeon]|nr:class I SAM-dependent methyltransferase [Candidatus Micrarchaeota archaeon]